MKENDAGLIGEYGGKDSYNKTREGKHPIPPGQKTE